MFVSHVPGWNKFGFDRVSHLVPHFYAGIFVRISTRWKILCLP